MALAEATRGATEWEGLDLLSGSRINDIATALSTFCSQYSPKRWGDLLRQALPELTAETRTLNGYVVLLKRWSLTNQL